MRVLVSGGGTAGHINPALAIADKIKAEQPDSVIEYVGTPTGMENKLVPKSGYKIHGIAVRGFKRKLSLDNIDAAIKAITSVSKAKKIIKEFDPDIVIGTGGYVCWPVMKAAAKMGIPTAIHESNAVPGVTAKMLSKMVDRGQIKGCIADGPLALDVAIDKESVEIKGLVSPVAGDADCLLFPNIESGNVFYKANSKLVKGVRQAGILVGAKVPCVLSSRADSIDTKLNSIAIAAMSVR